MAAPAICIYGAGSIGCYVGGRLAATGSTVTFVGRERLRTEVLAHGLHLTDYLGADLRVATGQAHFGTDPALAAAADLVLVTVKSAGTATAGGELARVLKPGAVVVSFQNGLRNGAVLRERLPGRVVLTGMVQFNVLHRAAGTFHHGTEGGLEVEQHAALAPFADAFAAAGLPLRQRQDMVAVQWGKLLLNLNNAINALCGVPLKQELSQRPFRRCLALAQQELLALLDAAGIVPAQLTALPPRLIPKVIGVPDWLFRIVARRMIAIDPLARSSMWEDLEAGRRTEVDWLNGEVVRLAHEQGRAAPVNARLVELVRAAEQGGRRDWTGGALLAELQQAQAASLTRTSA